MNSKKGKVYLVGAGPGDPSLLTIKGLWCLQEADVVVYDRLVGEYLLTCGRPDAELIYVGKTTDHHTLKQGEINRLLVELASSGKTVCRLKGGDPFVFGRGGEEAEELAAAGIPFEIVPGITSAVAVPAYAGIPVTHRDCASAFMVATGHRRRDRAGEEGFDCDFIRGGNCTAVFLMGYENLPAIVSNLKSQGWDEQTPVALVHWGTRAEQRTVTGTLSNIEEVVREARIGPPSIFIAGKVVNLKRVLEWREARPLFGQRILITRALNQTEEFARKIMELGGEPVSLPVLSIEPVEDTALLEKALGRLGCYDWLIFTSVNGVRFFMEALRERNIDIREVKGRIAAIGPATAAALARLGLKVAYRPDEFRAEALLEGLSGAIPAGSRVLVPRAAEAREVLVEGLAARGVDVEVVAVYRTRPSGERFLPVVRELLEEGRISVITFASSSAVRNFAALLGDDLHRLVGRSRIACIGPVTSGTARELGLQVGVEAGVYTIDGLLQAIIGKGGTGR